jgi:hypothetical protein
MPKTCSYKGCNNPVWSKGRCKYHPLAKSGKNKRKSGLKRTPINKVSGKKAKRDAAYSVLREKYLKDNPICQICNTAHSTDVHHKYAGADRAKYQNDVTTWMALCRGCHTHLHEHPSWARENNYLK